jgi:YegS/Rv2252/BmrU family lipid kinase
MAVVVVANPTAGRGKAARLIPRVDALLRSLDVPHSLLLCEGPEDPERLAGKAAAEGAEIVAALGGDGQVGACANGLLGTQTALAVIPSGTGNDFARHLGLNRKDPLGAARLLSAPSFKVIDVAKVTTPDGERHYVNVGGAGFDSEVNELANRVRRLRGTPKYVYSTFVTLARFKPGKFVVTVDGTEHTFKGMMLAVGNGSSYGGGMRVTPDARSDDGLLDVCVIQELSRWQFVKAFPKVFSGTHVNHPAVTMLQGKEIEISAERPFQVYADGEPVGRLPATFSVVPAALRVVIPGQGAGG